MKFLKTSVDTSCKICHKAFANVYRLQRHMISHDESALLRKFKCNQCDKAFKFKHHLKEHVRIHSGEKPFGCDNCGKRFSHSGSFSSHMTSKKCISMGLKLNNNRALLKTLEKNAGIVSPNQLSPTKRNSVGNKVNGLTENAASNGATMTPSVPNPMNYFASDVGANGAPSAAAPFYQNLLPKYNDYNAMNAAFLATFPNTFYSMALDARMHPYSIQRLLELTAVGQQQQHQQPAEQHQHEAEDMIEEITEEETPDEPKLVMDLDENDPKETEDTEVEEDCKSSSLQQQHEDEQRAARSASPVSSISHSPAEQQIVNDQPEEETAKNVEKYSIKQEQSRPTTPQEELSIEHAPKIKIELDNADVEELAAEPEATVESETIEQHPAQATTPELRCSRCDKQFNHPTELVQHEKVLCGLIKQELEQHYQHQQQQQLRINESLEHNNSANSSFLQSSDVEEDDHDERDSSASRNDCSSENGERKVRVRTAITEEQQQQLKQHYTLNARPSRDEFRMIAARLQLDARVVQVWFQNNRSRERKLQTYHHQNSATSAVSKLAFPMQTVEHANIVSSMDAVVTNKTTDEQPLDLSLKRDDCTASKRNGDLQLQHSPLYGIAPQQIAANADLNEAINLSRKMSTNSMSPSTSLSPSSVTSVPQAFKQAAAAALYFGAPPPHHLRQTPSPNDLLPQQTSTPRNSGGFLPTHLPPYMLPSVTQRSLVPMEALFQMTPAEYARHHHPLINSIKLPDYRGTSLSPGGSEKRSWRDDESRISHEDDFGASLMPPKPKRAKAETHGHAGDPDLPFICDQCDKAFAKQSSLARHKYEHSGQRPYQCVDCPKAFKHKHHLTEHKRLHSGEKPFQCSKCLKRFSHSGSYSQHMNHRYSYCKPYRE